MKTRKMTSAALALVLSAVMAFGLAAPARAMDLGAFAPSFDASLATQSFQQQVELSVNLAVLQAEAAQSSAQWQAESSLAAAQQELNALQNTPVVSEGGNLNGGLGDPNTIIVSEGGNLNGGLGDPNTIIVSEGGNLNGGLGDPNTIIVSEGGNLNGGLGDPNTIIVQGGTPIVGLQRNHIKETDTVELLDSSELVLENRGIVQKNYGTVQENRGIVQFNKGTVQDNYGTLQENWGTVQDNYDTLQENWGTVQLNYITVQRNYVTGTVQVNNGTVQVNDGTVQNNRRTVLTNTRRGTVTRNTGTVNENSGTVDNYTNGIVKLNKEGGIVFNYGGSITENLGIELFQVTINRSANTSVTDATDGLTAHNGEAWKQEGDISGQSATVTISPAVGYTITNIAAAEGISPVRNADGTWTVTVDASLVNAKEFTLDTTVAQNTGSYPPFNYGDDPDPYFYGGYSDSTAYDDSAYFAGILSLLNITMEPSTPGAVYNAGPNAYDRFNDARIAELSAASENGTVTIDLRETGWTTLKREVFEAAARRGDVTIVILYTHWGQDCTLTIPAGTDFSALFEAQFLEVSQLPALLHLSAV